MTQDEKRALIDKIASLPRSQQKKLQGYVDALLEESASSSGNTSGEPRQANVLEPGSVDDVEEYVDLSFRGALKDLRDQYTSVELQHEIRDEWRKTVDDS